MKQLTLAWPVSRRDDIREHGSQHTSGSVTDDKTRDGTLFSGGLFEGDGERDTELEMW
jgi:hypothetical protein